MDNLSIQTHINPQTGVIILTCTGRITMGENCKKFAEEIELVLVRYTHPKVMLNLTSVIYIDSSGLQSITRYCTILRNNGGDIYIVGTTEKISELLRITKISQIIDCFSTEEDALKSFSL